MGENLDGVDGKQTVLNFGNMPYSSYEGGKTMVSIVRCVQWLFTRFIW
jgi:hypothetical protein